MSLIDQENELFNKWSQLRENFSPDGIVSDELYLSQKPKIMFILKEVNSKHGETVELKDFIRNAAYNRKPTWDNLTKWIYGIRNLNQDFSWSEISSKEFLTSKRVELIPTVSVINIKKSPGGHTSDHTELATVAEQDKNLLNDQINLYFSKDEWKPDLIIAGGSATSYIFNNLVELPKKTEFKQTSRGIWYYQFDDQRHFIDYAHPEARVQDSLLYYGLVDAIREIRKTSINNASKQKHLSRR